MWILLSTSAGSPSPWVRTRPHAELCILSQMPWNVRNMWGNALNTPTCKGRFPPQPRCCVPSLGKEWPPLCLSNSSVLEAQMEPGFFLLPLLFLFSQCLCHEDLAATHSQKQGLSRLVCSRITPWRSRGPRHLTEKMLVSQGRCCFFLSLNSE